MSSAGFGEGTWLCSGGQAVVGATRPSLPSFPYYMAEEGRVGLEIKVKSLTLAAFFHPSPKEWSKCAALSMLSKTI